MKGWKGFNWTSIKQGPQYSLFLSTPQDRQVERRVYEEESGLYTETSYLLMQKPNIGLHKGWNGCCTDILPWGSGPTEGLLPELEALAFRAGLPEVRGSQGPLKVPAT